MSSSSASSTSSSSTSPSPSSGLSPRVQSDDRIEPEERKDGPAYRKVVLNEGSIARRHCRILVTGGAGFIGSHLIDRLMKDEHNVVLCVDNMFSGSKSNIAHWLSHPRFEFIRHDVQEPLAVEVDQIYHLACPASPVFYQHNGIRTIKTNVLGTLNMLGLAKRLGARFLLASTSEVYGDPDVHPQVEEYWGNVNPIGIRACFGEDTRVLTSAGFLFVSEVERMIAEGKPIQYACYDVKRESLVYSNGKLVTPPNEKKTLISFTTAGDTEHSHSNNFSIRVTGDHKMFVQTDADRNTKHGGRTKISARALMDNKKAVRFLCVAENGIGDASDGRFEAYLKEKLDIEGVRVEEFLRFYGYWLGNGSLHFHGSSGNDYDSVSLVARSSHDVLYLKDALDKMGLVMDADYKKTTVSGGETRFDITNKKWVSLFHNEYGRTSEKWLFPSCSLLTRNQCRTVIEGLHRVDGEWGEAGNSKVIFASGAAFRDEILQLMLHGGYSPSFERCYEKGAICGYPSKDSSNNMDNWRIHYTANDSSCMPTVSGKDMKEESYGGRIWCVTVDHPDHLIVVQRAMVDADGVIMRTSLPVIIGNCYDEGKRLAETLAFEYYRQHKVAIRVSRIFNTYGPRMLENDGRVVSNFIVQALKGEPLTVYGDGSQTRSFQYVDDLVEGLIRLMNGDYIGPVNLGNPGEYTILELARAVQDAINPDASIIHKEVPSDDPRRRKPDISKAKKYLNGWEPKVPLKEGLALTINDFQKRYKNGDF